MGTVTTFSHLLYNQKTGQVARGTKREIVDALYATWRVTKDRAIVGALRILPRNEITFPMGMAAEWTREEMQKEAVKYLFDRLVVDFGFEHYRQIDF